MNIEQLNHIETIKPLIRNVNRENLNMFNFSKKKDFDKIEDKFLYNLPFDLFETFHKYIDLIIEHVNEIRKEDCYNIYLKGFSNGIEFERYLKDKHEKSEL